MVKWLREHVDFNATVLELGCGNGHLLVSMYVEGYRKLMGVDYASESIVLARQISEAEGVTVGYETRDILSADFNEQAHLVIDKGTLDAISLTPADGDAR